MTSYQLDRYFTKVERVAIEYDLLVIDILDLVEYHDSRRVRRGHREDLERSLDVLERTLRIKRR